MNKLVSRRGARRRSKDVQRAPKIIAITGMERSGTSLVARIANLLGVFLGPNDGLIMETEYNPTGCWEHRDLLLVSEEILVRLGGNTHDPPEFPTDWETTPMLADLRARARMIIDNDFGEANVWGWKDTRTCLTMPFWQSVLPQMSYIVCVRNPVDVATSLTELGWVSSFDQGVAAWLRYLVSAIQYTRNQSVLFVSYEDLVRDVPANMERLAEFLGVQGNLTERVRQAVTAFADTNLCHHRSSLVEVMDHPRLPLAVKTLYGFTLHYVWASQAHSKNGPESNGELRSSLEELATWAMAAYDAPDSFHSHAPAHVEAAPEAPSSEESQLLNRTIDEGAAVNPIAQRIDAQSTGESVPQPIEVIDTQVSAQIETVPGESSLQQAKGDGMSAEELAMVRELVLRAYPETVAELVGGESVAALLESLEPAASAYRRIAEEVAASVAVPMASVAPTEPEEELGPEAPQLQNGAPVEREVSDPFAQETNAQSIIEPDSEPVETIDRVAACTIIAKNYLAFARVFASSFHEHHPDIPVYVLLVDRVDGYFDPSVEPFELIELSELDIPDAPALCFKYNVTELNCAVKPYFIDHLLTRHSLDKVVYLDPDILIVNPLTEVFDALKQHSIVLTPHLTEPQVEAASIPLELNILQSGTFNLGFIGVSNSSETRVFLQWWKTRLHSHCQRAAEQGMLFDQKWIDLVPSLFSDVAILRHPGYNVAYWNLPSRTIELSGHQFLVKGEPLHFYHFSGFDPYSGTSISKHNSEISGTGVGSLDVLFRRYRALLFSHGYDDVRGYPYAFDRFDNDATIHPYARTLYLQMGNDAAQFGDPFSTALPDSYFRWLNAGIDGDTSSRRVTRLWYEIYQRRDDLQKAFPDVLGQDRKAFLKWILSSGIKEERIDPRMVPGVQAVQGVKRRSEAEQTPRLEELAHRPFGVNVAGYIASEKGSGEAARAQIRSLDAARIPFVVNSVCDVHGALNREEIRGTAKVVAGNPYRINLIHVNADQVPNFVNDVGPDYLDGHYNVAYWLWELDELPREWFGSFQYFDEIWTPSNFVLDAVSRVSPVPVVRVPLAIPERPDLPPPNRRLIGVDEDEFMVLYMFDFYSYFDRKNPLGVIEAFTRAFESRDRARLVIKCAHSEFDPGAFATMKHAVDAVDGIIIDEVLSRSEVENLMLATDCYLSLHRSEGFGLTIAEAMLMGKPVIATAYSGNMDFMNLSNSFPLRYEIREIPQDHGPYRRGQRWAEPDVDQAAQLLRFVYEKRDLARAIGENGRQTILRDFSPQAIGTLVRNRLEVVAGDSTEQPSRDGVLFVMDGAGTDRNSTVRDFPVINQEEGEGGPSHLARVVRLIDEAIASGGTHLLVPREHADWLGDHPLLAEYFAVHHEMTEASAETGIVFKLNAVTS